MLVPEDEAELAQMGFADSIKTFVPETLNEICSVPDAVRPHLSRILRDLIIEPGAIGVETGAKSQAASYLAIHLFGGQLSHMLHELLPYSKLTAIENWIRDLGSVKTSLEIARIRRACAVAQKAFELGAPALRPGITEQDAALLFRAPLCDMEASGSAIHRADGYAFCMSGQNSAKAHAAYARTRWRTLQSEDLVMMHCNSYLDGLWTDITRTFTLKPPDQKQEQMYAAVFAAREAALGRIKAGARAPEIDAACQQVMREFGMEQFVKHGTGHGVGFSPMSAYSVPQIHAGSADVLREGTVFNVEPAVYVEGYGGVRHCDMVAVTSEGYELLTSFQSEIKSLTVANGLGNSKSFRSRATA